MQTRFAVLILLLLMAPFLRAEAPAPQFGLPKVTLGIGTLTVEAQVAADESSRERGLMSRTNLGSDEAMLFVFPAPRPVAFWMKNTPVPLSVAYIGPSGRIFEIHDLQPLDETPVPSASDAVTYALEVPQGWFARNGVPPGEHIRGLPSPAKAR
jgi:hypothetical protein